MKEILIIGDVTKDFERLGVEVRQTYKGEEYGICEVTDNEFKILCDEPDIKGTWVDCGWRYCEGSNQEEPTKKVIVNGKEIIGWYDDFCDFESDEEEQDYLEEHGGVVSPPEHKDLLTYLCDEIGCSQPRNVCALAKDLAKYNNMTMGQLFTQYSR